ncbi:MAG: PEP-CTERM sorting domain-containing protein [Rhodoferax sp.]|uniref:PEP-CTERM sorting domain-containing protein n=1 Tax=Rhodoferax sp. TaxID=50421 RepID=UPI00262AF310|nr:PEP-CTERM sorting domain-containing protein [Rhodoferax sp.]MDD5334011.1 PEP-CTERM sorting domain-containing protein [Rhodoferax sp.]
MKYRPHSLFTLTLLASLTLVSAPSLAQTALVAETGTASGQTLNLQLPVYPSGAQNYFTGAQNITVDGTSFLAFCIDPFQYSSGSPSQYNVSSSLTSLLSATQAADVSRLYSQSYASTTGNALNSAAFQLALWELANDNGDLSSGSVRATNLSNGAVTAAGSMINNARNGVAGSTQYTFNLYTNPARQDFLVTVSAVPEPESYAMLLAGLGLMGAVVRRRKPSCATL